jgi:hypothetical protein
VAVAIKPVSSIEDLPRHDQSAQLPPHLRLENIPILGDMPQISHRELGGTTESQMRDEFASDSFNIPSDKFSVQQTNNQSNVRASHVFNQPKTIQVS